MTRIAEVPFGSPEYDATLRLRHDVLRVPLNLALTAADTRGEAAQHHFAAFEDGALVGCVSLAFPDAHTAKMRQLAVLPEARGKGVATALIAAVERAAAGKGAHELVLHARLSAVALYQRLGYTLEGPLFFEVGVPHYKMRKALAH